MDEMGLEGKMVQVRRVVREKDGDWLDPKSGDGVMHIR